MLWALSLENLGKLSKEYKRRQDAKFSLQCVSCFDFLFLFISHGEFLSACTTVPPETVIAIIALQTDGRRENFQTSATQCR